jgi:hypothetical protein
VDTGLPYVPGAKPPGVPDHGKLPATYEAASRALAECARIDECKEWKDRAEALASYARQAHDDHLVKMAMRIQLRANRRMGELLEPYKNPGARTDQPIPGPVGRSEPRSQLEAGREAGLSRRQIETAAAVAKVPQAEFDRQVDSDTPPTVAKLVRPEPRMGEPGWMPPPGFKEATRLHGALGRLAEACAEVDPSLIVRGSSAREIAVMHQQIQAIDRWIDSFLELAPESREEKAA